MISIIDCPVLCFYLKFQSHFVALWSPPCFIRVIIVSGYIDELKGVEKAAGSSSMLIESI